jgi:broad specificity phosphatase PhoE
MAETKRRGSLTLVFVRHGETVGNRDNIRQGQLDYPLTETGVVYAKCVGLALKNVKWFQMWSSDLPRTLKTTSYLLEQRDVSNVGASSVGSGSRSIYLLDTCTPPKDIHALRLPNRAVVQQTTLAREVFCGIREGLPKEMTFEEARSKVAHETSVLPETIIDTSETITDVVSRQKLLLLDMMRNCYQNKDGQAVLTTTSTSALAVTDSSSASVSVETGAEPGPGLHFGNVLCVSHGLYMKIFLKEWCGVALTNIKNCSVTRVHVTWDIETSSGAGKTGVDLSGVVPDSIVCTADSEYVNCTSHLPDQCFNTEEDALEYTSKMDGERMYPF